MSIQSPGLLPLSAVAALVLSASSASAALLMIDFGTAASPVQSGFIGQSVTGVTHSTIAGNITVSFSGQQGTFDRGATGPAGLNHNLYRDFIFDNTAGSPTITITLTGPGISASTDYSLTFYAFDSSDNRNTSFAGASGTVGATLGPVIHTNTAPDPTTLDQYAVTGTFTPSNDGDGTGTLTFNVNSPPLTRAVVNGFQLTAVPEPGAALLGSLGMLMLLRRRRN